MRRRSKLGGEPVKARRRKSVTLKRRKAKKVTLSRPSSGKDKKIALLRCERDEALARQIATADIPRIISQSPTDVRPVFDSIVFTAVRLLRCDLVFVPPGELLMTRSTSDVVAVTRRALLRA